MKVGRNEACPCGSGKKCKKCCLGKEKVAVAQQPGLAQSYPSARTMYAQPNRPDRYLPAYSLAKLFENPDLPRLKPQLRKRMIELTRVCWTRAKVAGLSTEAIEQQLRDYGVPYSREGFLQKCEQGFSAWQVSESWFGQGPLKCRGMDEDFLGLGACELWKRLLPERPSMEMIDDWLDDGHKIVVDDPCRGCEFWWKAWRGLQPGFTPQMRTLDATAPIFRGTHQLFNWCQDFELWLTNAALKDVRFASLGEQFCREWLAQFTQESANLQVSYRRAWAEFTFRLGQVERAREILEETLEAFPMDPWSYIALADAYSHLFADRTHYLPFDLEKAREYMELGQKRIRAKRDRADLQERLDGLSEMVPVWEKPPARPARQGSLTIEGPPGILQP